MIEMIFDCLVDSVRWNKDGINIVLTIISLFLDVYIYIYIYILEMLTKRLES